MNNTDKLYEFGDFLKKLQMNAQKQSALATEAQELIEARAPEPIIPDKDTPTGTLVRVRDISSNDWEMKEFLGLNACLNFPFVILHRLTGGYVSTCVYRFCEILEDQSPQS